MEKRYVVRAEFDEEAGVWVAEGANFPGLVTEAATLDELEKKLRVMIPEILEENGLIRTADEAANAPFSLLAASHASPFHAV